jgi:hypothetical protein
MALDVIEYACHDIGEANQEMKHAEDTKRHF